MANEGTIVVLPGPWALPTGSKNTVSIRFNTSVVSNADLPFGVGRIALSGAGEMSTAWDGGALQAIAAVTDQDLCVLDSAGGYGHGSIFGMNLPNTQS